MEGVTLYELFSWREALASCAIEGNKYAQEQLKLWGTNAFVLECIKQREIRNAKNGGSRTDKMP